MSKIIYGTICAGLSIACILNGLVTESIVFSAATFVILSIETK